MNNADMPAMPTEVAEYDRDGNLATRTKGGLTKREHFAALAMQGMLASEGHGGAWFTSMRDMAEKAVEAADATLAELERTS